MDHTDFVLDDLVQLTRQKGFDFSLDTWLIRTGVNSHVGFAMLWQADAGRMLYSFGVVHPSHQGRGLGATLLRGIEERAGRLRAESPGPVVLRHHTYGNDSRAHEMLRERGFVTVRHEYTMLIETGEETIDIPEVSGISIARCGVDLEEPEAREIHELIEETFRNEWGRSPRTFEEWTAQSWSRKDHDKSLWFLARDGAGQLVGALLGNLAEDVGWVGALGVLEKHRRRGIATALLKHSFAEFQGRGVEKVGLGVDAANPTGAVGVYERAGMHAISSYEIFEKAHP
ncbi:MAG: mycothiol synthase [Actinomycetota bacterium]|nr:mycothiol synthase [Actinomycetota bacterium]